MARTSARVSLPEPEVEGEERRRVVRLRLDVRESRRAAVAVALHARDLPLGEGPAAIDLAADLASAGQTALGLAVQEAARTQDAPAMAGPPQYRARGGGSVVPAVATPRGYR